MKYIILTCISLISYLSFSIESEKESTLLGWNALKGNETFGMCFKKGERVSGLNKICTYTCTSGDKSITIKSTQLCPLSIDG